MNLIQKDEETGYELLSIFGPNSEPWYVADIAGMLHGITLAPLYNTLGPDVIKYVLN
jgi:long-subunit acyl-CoA synthetase (AMP-forming)